MYVQDFDETFPLYFYNIPKKPSDSPFSPNVQDTVFGWNEAIYPYVKNIQVFRCPDTPRATGLPSIGGTVYNADDTNATGATSYAINARIVGDTGGIDDGIAHPPLADAALDFAAATILLVDSSSDCGDGCATSDENEWAWQGRHVDNLYGDGWVSGNEPGAQFIRGTKAPLTRHIGGANYAFSDGPVKFINAGQMGLMTNPSYPATENTAAVVADSNGQHPTYCPNSNCVYNVPLQ